LSKKYKGKTCAYCAAPGSSKTADHIVAREFFLPERRANLPKVAACNACNNSKSVLEHYLASVLPFGGRHPDASVNLATMVQPRLAKNLPLAKKLQGGREISYKSRDGVQWTPDMKMPFDGKSAERLFTLITKGLANFHWQLCLPDTDCIVCSSFLTPEGEAMFRRLWSVRASATVQGDLGNGTFVYEGRQGVDDPRLTVWRMSLYGIVVGGDVASPNAKSTTVFAMTAPRRMRAASELAQILVSSHSSSGFSD